MPTTRSGGARFYIVSRGIIFGDGSVLVSKVVHNDGTLITKATLHVNTDLISGSGTLTWYLSADGGANWEQVTLDQTHTFTNTGTQLKYKAVASGSVVIDCSFEKNLKIIDIDINK